ARSTARRVLGNDSPGEMPALRLAAVRARNSADRSEQRCKQQHDHPSRKDDGPGPELPLTALLFAPALDHSRHHICCGAANRSVAHTGQPRSRIAAMLFTSPRAAAGSELDPKLPDQDLLSTIEVGDHLALAPVVFEAGVDKCYWAPDQVGMQRRQPLVRGKRLQRADELRRHAVIIIAER